MNKLTVPNDVMPMPSFTMTCSGSGSSVTMKKILGYHEDHHTIEEAIILQCNGNHSKHEHLACAAA